jgi:hypothetical protein
LFSHFFPSFRIIIHEWTHLFDRLALTNEPQSLHAKRKGAFPGQCRFYRERGVPPPFFPQAESAATFAGRPSGFAGEDFVIKTSHRNTADR